MLFDYYADTLIVEQHCKGVLELLDPRNEDDIKVISSEFRGFLKEQKMQTKLSLAFIGQYNAGKSTIIASLTNAEFVNKYYKEVDGKKKLIEVYRVGDKEINIGAQIMTDKSEDYVCHDVFLFDTPGIYSGRIDHDDVVLDRISKTDLLVFVISNELFNPEAGVFFRKLALELKRVGQMVLVVNKMSRETGDQENLEKSILEVIEPYHPMDFYTCFIDADSYLKSQNENEEDEKQYLEEESNFEELLNALQKVIEKNRYSARQATPLNRAVDILEQAANICGGDTALRKDILELLRRKRILITNSKIRFYNKCVSILNKLDHEIVMIGEKAVKKVDGKHEEDEVKKAINDSTGEINNASEKAIDAIKVTLEEEMGKLQESLEELGNSDLSNAVKDEIKSSQKEVKGRGVAGKKGIPEYVKKGPKTLGKLGGFASKVSRDMVYKAGKFIGIKFKPWGAVKAAKFVNKLSPVLSVVGTLLDIFLAAKEEKDLEDAEQKIREARADLRSDYRETSAEIKKEYMDQIKENIITDFYDEEIKCVESEQNEITNHEKADAAFLEQVRGKTDEIKNLVARLTSAN